MSMRILVHHGRPYDQPYEDMYEAYELGLINDVEFGSWLAMVDDHLPSDTTGFLMEDAWRYFGRTYDRKFPMASFVLRRTRRKISHGQPMLTKRQLHPRMPRDSSLRSRRSAFSAYYADRQMLRRREAAMDLQEQIDDAVDDLTTDVVSVSTWFGYCNICDRERSEPVLETEVVRFNACLDSYYDQGEPETDRRPEWLRSGFASQREYEQYLDEIYSADMDLSYQN